MIADWHADGRMAASEEVVLAFVRSSIKSAWALELLLLLYRGHGQRWSVRALVRELRGSFSLVYENLSALAAAGLISESDGDYHYAPQSRESDELVAGLVDLYGRKPLTILNTIFTAPSDKIRSFSDAFLLKRK